MLEPFYTSSFKRGLDIEKLHIIVEKLINLQPMPKRYKDHQLKGEWVGFCECHIEPDWLLIYKIETPILKLVRTGTHADLF